MSKEKIKSKLTNYTKDELRIIARELNVQGYSNKRKIEIIELLLSSCSLKDVQRAMGIGGIWSRHKKTISTIIIALIIGGIYYLPTATKENQEKMAEDIKDVGKKGDEIIDGQKELKDLMISIYNTSYKTLSAKYPLGYFLFATGKYTVIPSNQKKNLDFTLDWENSKINFMDNEIIYIILPEFEYLPKKIKFKKVNILLERYVGAIARGLFFEDVGFYVELLNDKEDELIYVIGYKRVASLPKHGKLKPKVSKYKDLLGLSIPGFVSIERSKSVTFNNFTFTSGWENYSE